MGSAYDYFDFDSAVKISQATQSEQQTERDSEPITIPKRRKISESIPQAILDAQPTKDIPLKLYNKLNYLGLIPNSVRKDNAGESNYSEKIIQPWSIWLDYNLTAFDADILKRVLRTKETNSRQLDYEKIIHICQERIRQLNHQDE